MKIKKVDDKPMIIYTKKYVPKDYMFGEIPLAMERYFTIGLFRNEKDMPKVFWK